MIQEAPFAHFQNSISVSFLLLMVLPPQLLANADSPISLRYKLSTTTSPTLVPLKGKMPLGNKLDQW